MLIVEVLIGTGLVVFIGLAFYCGYKVGRASKKNKE
jgi:hypothetical protein